MLAQLTVAAAPVATLPGALEDNLALLDAACGEAVAQGAHLVLFPELSLTGFLPNHPQGPHAPWLADALAGAWRMALPLDSAPIDALHQMSRRHNVFLAPGLLEHAGNVLYNTHLLIGEGRTWGVWRKMHVPVFETPFYNGGGPAPVVDTPLGRIGVNICFDAFLPESTRLLAVQNAEIVLFPFAADPSPVTPDGWFAWAKPVLQARCAENAVFGVACNYLGEVSFARVSQRFPGGSAVLNPNGSTLSGPHAGTTVANLSHEALVEARSAFEYTFRFRRPELYGSLAR
ncbi:MAG: carbon-nitrogen hydrolase family protein [Bryobacterales bacterium]|jgi:predicted amidohydrolase|nr:carbon-nitrogen hydrolase family protein [Bryobacterales bacterium]